MELILLMLTWQNRASYSQSMALLVHFHPYPTSWGCLPAKHRICSSCRLP